MQLSLPQIPSVCYSPSKILPDGLSHTLWRTGGEKRGGGSKKEGKLSSGEKKTRVTASFKVYEYGRLYWPLGRSCLPKNAVMI